MVSAFEVKEHGRVPRLNAAGPAFACGFGAAGLPSPTQST